MHVSCRSTSVANSLIDQLMLTMHTDADQQFDRRPTLLAHARPPCRPTSATASMSRGITVRARSGPPTVCAYLSEITRRYGQSNQRRSRQHEDGLHVAGPTRPCTALSRESYSANIRRIFGPNIRRIYAKMASHRFSSFSERVPWLLHGKPCASRRSL